MQGRSRSAFSKQTAGSLCAAVGAALCVLLVTACGGGGGGGSSAAISDGTKNTTPAASPEEPGTIKVLFGDGPTDEFDQALFDIQEMRLLGDDGQEVLILEEPAEFDLLQLRNINELVVDAEVPAGVYSKIRMKVRSITLVKLDPYEEIRVQVPANGKVDLNPQQDIQIAPGEAVVVEVDVDLDRAIHVVKTGNGKYRFRPVVFVTIIDQPENGRYVRLYGTLDQIADDGATMNICDLDPLSKPMGVPSTDCYPVRVVNDALRVDDMGEPIPAENLAALGEDQFATLLARFHYGLETGDGYFQAILVALGEEGIYEQRFGQVTGVVEDGRFTLAEDGAAEEDPDTVAGLVDGALIFDEDDHLQGPEAIQPGFDAELWGIAPEAGEPDPVFRTIVVYLDEPDNADSVSGDLLVINLAKNQLIIEQEDFTEQCIQVTDNTEYFQISKDDEKIAGARILLDELSAESDLFVQAYGVFDGGCLVAEEVVVETDLPVTED